MPEKKFELSPSISILIAGVVIAGAIIYVNQHPATPELAAVAQQAATPQNVSVRSPAASDHIIGSPSAPVVLIEYSDFQCPFCQLIYPTIKKIVDDSNGQVAWVMREFPLVQIHPNAGPAANAAECIAAQAGSTGFWKFADTIFANQSKMSDAFYASIAQGLGINMSQYNTCVQNSQYQKQIDADAAEAQSAGGQGTPFTIVLNTKTGKAVPVSGAVSAAQLQAAITQVKGN